MLGVSELESVVHVLPPAPAPKPPISPEEKSPVVLLDDLRETVKKHGATGMIGVARKFRIMDDDNSKIINIPEFTKACAELKLNWNTEQIKAVFDSFDKDKSGGISLDEFIVGLRGPMNDRRKQLVLQAFEILDKDKSGVVELNDIKGVYNASKHPDVIARKRTEDEVLREFLDSFDGGEKDGKIYPFEFCEYYSNLSANIDLDDYFELMMRNAWHISGGEGWCENTTCRRVLVTHKDGRQTVEEIKNDLGIDRENKAAMLAKLAEQGVDAAGIDLFGSVDSKSPAEPEAAAAPVVAAKSRTGAVSTNPGRAVGGATSIVFG